VDGVDLRSQDGDLIRMRDEALIAGLVVHHVEQTLHIVARTQRHLRHPPLLALCVCTARERNDGEQEKQRGNQRCPACGVRRGTTRRTPPKRSAHAQKLDRKSTRLNSSHVKISY